MTDTVAYQLRADYADTFQGGVLATDTGYIHIYDALQAGDGTIVVHANDQVLRDLLAQYPPLKQVPAPDNPAVVVSRYDRMPLDALRHQASLRDIGHASSASRAKVTAALEQADAAQVEAVRAGDGQAAESPVDAADLDGQLITKTPVEFADLKYPDPLNTDDVEAGHVGEETNA